jgi:hypothetical protein
MIWWLVGGLLLAGIASLFAAAWRLDWRPVVAAVPLCVAAVVIAGWHVTRAAETSPLDPDPDAQLRIAALGDSYISGEGAQNYFPGTDVRNNDCHRAASAYPYLAAKELDASLTFVACSGARTWHVTGRDAAGMTVLGQHPKSDPSVYGGRPQVDVLDGLDKLPSVVLLSIGGNDAGFADIGRRCAASGSDCRDSAEYWLDRLDEVVYPALLSTYSAVKDAARGAPVLVMTYPSPLGPHFCPDVLLSQGEFRFVRDVFVGHLNALIKYAAAVDQVRVVDLTDALNGHRFCEVPLSKAAINFVDLRRTAEPTSLEHLGSIYHGTFHPNALGHQLIEQRVIGPLRAAQAGTLPPLPQKPRSDEPDFDSLPRGGVPPVTDGFPTDAPCKGTTIAFVSPLSVAAGTRSVALSDLRPGSTVCFHAYLDDWRTLRASGGGVARVPVNVSNPGIGGLNEVLAQQSNGAWKRVAISRLGVEGDSKEPPPADTGLYVVLVLLGLGVVAALVLHWTSRKRARPA